MHLSAPVSQWRLEYVRFFDWIKPEVSVGLSELLWSLAKGLSERLMDGLDTRMWVLATMLADCYDDKTEIYINTQSVSNSSFFYPAPVFNFFTQQTRCSSLCWIIFSEQMVLHLPSHTDAGSQLSCWFTLSGCSCHESNPRMMATSRRWGILNSFLCHFKSINNIFKTIITPCLAVQTYAGLALEGFVKPPFQSKEIKWLSP